MGEVELRIRERKPVKSIRIYGFYNSFINRGKNALLRRELFVKIIVRLVTFLEDKKRKTLH